MVKCGYIGRLINISIEIIISDISELIISFVYEGLVRNIEKTIIHKICFKVLLILIMLLLVLLLCRSVNKGKKADDFVRELSFLLNGDERIIDYKKQGLTVYSIICNDKAVEQGNLFVVFDYNESNKWERSYENDFTELKPWKLELSDIDGDDIQEILIAVKKTTIFDDTVKNRMFIFNYLDGKLVKKWTGSQIAGTWRDFYVGELVPIPGNELIFISKEDSGREKLCIYYWFDFGFFMLADSDSFQYIEDVSILSENRIKLRYIEGDEYKDIVLRVKGEKLIEEVHDMK